MSVISITKRNLTLEIQKIDEKAEYIEKLKDEAIQTLLEQKNTVLSGPCKSISKLPAKIDSKIEHLKEQHDTVMGKYSEKQLGIHGEKADYDVLGEDLDEIDMELRAIEERHNDVMEQLESKRAFLVDQLGSIENMEQEVVDLEAELIKAKAGLQSQMDMKGSKMSLSEMGAMEKEIDDLNDQITVLNSLEYLQTKCRNTSQDIERLEEARCLASSSAERMQIEGRLKTLSMQQAECDRLLALAAMSPDERFRKLLEERGLFYTPSGRIRTMSGQLLTLAEALALGLLNGLNSELSELFGLKITESGRIRTASGRLITPSEAGRLGLFKKDMSESSVSSSSSDTTLTGMSTADVHYLKANLGRPLALALAEITAKQPRDPIHYLGHWLFRYRYNQEMDIAQKLELEALLTERERLRRIALRKEAEEEAKITLLDLLGRVEIEAARREIEAELRRIEAEALAREEEEDILEIEATDTLGVYDGPPVNPDL